MMEDVNGSNGAEANALSASSVRREIWRSLISMLRVYAHAASLNYGEHAVTETGSDAVILSHKQGSLELNCQPGSGMAVWILKQPGQAESSGVFILSHQGRIEFDGQEKELDQAAIEWVEQLTRTGTAQRAS